MPPAKDDPLTVPLRDLSRLRALAEGNALGEPRELCCGHTELFQNRHRDLVPRWREHVVIVDVHRRALGPLGIDASLRRDDMQRQVVASGEMNDAVGRRPDRDRQYRLARSPILAAGLPDRTRRRENVDPAAAVRAACPLRATGRRAPRRA